MKATWIGLLIGALSALPLGLAHGECSDTEAWGGGATNAIVGDVMVWDYTCSACYGCTLEGYPSECGTDCVDASKIKPTHIIYQWNPATGHWEPIGTPSGECQEHITVDCQ